MCGEAAPHGTGFKHDYYGMGEYNGQTLSKTKANSFEVDPYARWSFVKFGSRRRCHNGRGRRSHSGAEVFCSCHKRTLWQTGVKHSARNYNSSGTFQLASASLASARASSY